MRRLGLLLALEGVLLAAVGIGYGVTSLSEATDRGPAARAGAAPGGARGAGVRSRPAAPAGARGEGAAAAAVVTGGVLLLLARAVSRGRAWARSPAVVLNVFPFPLALAALDAGAWWVALPLVLLPGAVLYLFATPELRLLFRERS